MYMTIQSKIASILMTQAIETDNPLKSILDGLTIQEVCYLIFHSYRGTAVSAKGMRLTDMGLNLLKTFFKCYDIDLKPGYQLKLPHLLYLDRVSTMPYWIDNSYCAMFDSELGMMFKLTEGDIVALIESRFRLTGIKGIINE